MNIFQKPINTANDPQPNSPLDNIEIASFRFTPMGLAPIGNPSFDDWISCGKRLHNFNKSLHFLIGDWISYGQSEYGEKYKEAIAVTGFDYQTLANDKWIASRIPPERRHPELSFAHHQEVADLDEEEQQELLKTAEVQKLPLDKFRKFIAGQQFQTTEKSKQQLSGDPEKTPVESVLTTGKQFLIDIAKLKNYSMDYNEKEDVKELMQDIATLVYEVLDYDDTKDKSTT